MSVAGDTIGTVGDIGAVIKIRVVEPGTETARDISDATSMQLRGAKPDGTAVAWTAVFVTDGTDGYMSYTTDGAADLDQAGTWSLEGRVVTATDDYRTSQTTFRIKGAL